MLKMFLVFLLQGSIVFAQAVPAPGTPEAISSPAPGWMQFVPIAVIMFVFYFFLIRPQAKKQKEHQGFLSTLKPGDQVITQSGILGRIAQVQDPVVNLEVANNVQIKVLKSQILGLQTPPAAKS